MPISRAKALKKLPRRLTSTRNTRVTRTNATKWRSRLFTTNSSHLRIDPAGESGGRVSRDPRTSKKKLEGKAPGAGADPFDLRVSHVGEREQQVRGRLLVLNRDVTIAAQAAIRSAQQNRRRVVPVVRVSIAHAGTPVDDGIVEQCAVAVGRGPPL